MSFKDFYSFRENQRKDFEQKQFLNRQKMIKKNSFFRNVVLPCLEKIKDENGFFSFKIIHEYRIDDYKFSIEILVDEDEIDIEKNIYEPACIYILSGEVCQKENSLEDKIMLRLLIDQIGMMVSSEFNFENIEIHILEYEITSLFKEMEERLHK